MLSVGYNWANRQHETFLSIFPLHFAISDSRGIKCMDHVFVVDYHGELQYWGPMNDVALFYGHGLWV